MKTIITKKLLTFILLLGGMFSFSVANAQVCDCVSSHPIGYCYLDNHGHTKCHRAPGNSGGFARMNENQSGPGIETLLQVYPNPVLNSTTISFSLEQSQNVFLKIFDMSGRLVATLADASFEEGDNEIIWNAADMNAGIYFLQFLSEENSLTIKLAVTK